MDKWETHIRARSLKGEWGKPPVTPGSREGEGINTLFLEHLYL